MNRPLSDQELVAFLDGEVSASEVAEIERRLAVEPELARRIGDLRHAWQLLDHLKPVEATDNFTKTTIKMTAVRSHSSDVSRFLRRRWKTMVGVCAAIVAGYLAVFLPINYERQKQLHDVPVIENVDLYLHAESVEFLRQLDSDGLFTQDIDLDEELSNVGSALDENRLTAAEVVETPALLYGVDRIQEFLDRLNPEQRAEFGRKRERFARLELTEQERRRELHRDLVADPGGERLYQVLVRYQQWIKTLSNSQKVELAGANSPTDRCARIRQIRQEQERRRFVELSDESEFNAADASVVMQWLGDYLENHAEVLIDQVPPHVRHFLQEQNDPRRRKRALGFAVLRFGDEMELPVPKPQEFEQLAKELSPKLAKELRSVEDGETKSKLVRGWLRARMLSAAPPPFVSDEELDVFYAEELPPEERERLDGLPLHEMHEELKHIYLRTKHPRYWDGGRFRRGGGRPPRHRGDDHRRPPDGRFRPPPPPPPERGPRE